MPKKATKTGRQAALRQSHNTARFAAADGGPTPSDPPIIITGGGSVTITSKVKLVESYDERKEEYTYYTDQVTVTRIKTKGKKPVESDDESDNGKFKTRLFDD